jgi:hypothetical protein
MKQQYSTLANYLTPPAGYVMGPNLPGGTPSLSNQKVLVDNLNFGNNALTHGGITDGRDHFTVDNAYPAASRNLCSSLQNRSCPTNSPAPPQNYAVRNPAGQVAVPVNQPVNMQAGVFDRPALAEANANHAGFYVGLGDRGRPSCQQANWPGDQSCPRMPGN